MTVNDRPFLRIFSALYRSQRGHLKQFAAGLKMPLALQAAYHLNEALL
jgi:hypothetical protein